MEIIICFSHRMIADNIQQLLSDTLIYKRGKMMDLYPALFNNIADIPQNLRTDISYLVIVEVAAKSSTLKQCQLLQNTHNNISFIAVGSNTTDCVMAVKHHIKLIDYFDMNEPALAEKIVNSIITQSEQSEYSFNGMFLYKEGEYNLIPLSEIRYIETVKGSHQSIVNCRNNICFYTRKTMEYLENCLGRNFFRCRSAVIINMMYVKEINTKERTITLDNGDYFHYPRKNVCKIKEILQRNFL